METEIPEGHPPMSLLGTVLGLLGSQPGMWGVGHVAKGSDP